ncbi:MAG: TPM domain-containing protein [Bacteroidota bacterium]
MRPSLFVSFLGLVVVASALAQPNVPALTGRVVDQADILSAHVESGLAQRLAQFEDSTGAQVVVLTIPSLDGAVLEEFATTVFRTWGLGQAGADNGVLLLVARDDRELRIEVGFGLEGDLTDAMAGRIIRNVIVPQFRAGDFDAGVLLGVDAILGSIEGTYVPPDDVATDDGDLIGLLLLPLFLFFQIAGHLYTGRDGRAGEVVLGWLGALAGGLAGIGIGMLTDVGWWLALTLVIPVVVIGLNRYLETRPRFRKARRKRRRKARIIRNARRAGKSSVMIDGVRHSVPSSSSGGGFSGGGGSSGGGGASGSW